MPISLQVKQKIQTYPTRASRQLQAIRCLIYQTAKEFKLGDIEETLKWNEPSYLINGGSTIRMDWKRENPEQIGIYFNCNTTLIDTFRELYPDIFKFEGNRAILLSISKSLPDTELKHCISLALMYHKLKHLPLLGN